MSEETQLSDPLYVLLGALASAFIGGTAWLCKNRCRNTEVDCNSGCCRIHTDSRLRETIRDEIQRSKNSDSHSIIDIEATD
jgi:hypothetical protein